MRTFSIIIAAYNETKCLLRLWESIKRQHVPTGWRVETILVDNGSTDGTIEAAIRMGIGKIVRCDGTIAACRNAGYEKSQGEIIAYIDADCEMLEDWLERAIVVVDRHDRVVAGWPVEPPRPSTWVQSAWYAHWTNKRGHVEERMTGDSAMTLITTANMIMPRKTFEDVGGFDPELCSGEDMNFLLRAQRLGIGMVASPNLRVIHHGEPRTLSSFIRQQHWHCSKSSFVKILNSGGGAKGGNAVWYTFLYTCALVMLLGGLYLIVMNGMVVGFVWVLPFIGLLLGPAMIISYRARRISFLFHLPILYFAYGWVRMCDWFGLHSGKKSWR